MVRICTVQGALWRYSDVNGWSNFKSIKSIFFDGGEDSISSQYLLVKKYSSISTLTSVAGTATANLLTDRLILQIGSITVSS